MDFWQSTLMSVAAMSLPVSVPFRGKAIADHGAGYVARARRRAEGSGSIAASAACGAAAHRRTVHRYMTGGPDAAARAQQRHQMIARRDRVSRRARMPRTARPVHFARCDAGQTDMRPLGAPDRPVAVPNRGWGAVERLTGRNNGGGEQEGENHGLALASSIDRRSPSGVTHHSSASNSNSSGVGSASSFSSSIRSRAIHVFFVIVCHGVHICPTHAVSQWSPSAIHFATG